MLESKLWCNRTETKNVMVAKMVEFIRTCDNALGSLFLVIFSAPVSSSLSAEKKYKKRMGEMGNFFLPGVVMIRTQERFLIILTP